MAMIEVATYGNAILVVVKGASAQRIKVDTTFLCFDFLGIVLVMLGLL